MRILVYYPYIPYPLDRGTYQRAFHLLRELSKDHEVDLLALTEGSERMEHRPVFEKMCRRVEFVPFTHPEWPKLSERLLDPVPTTIQHWSAPKVDAVLDEMIETGDYDLVHVCDIVLTQPFLDRHKDIPLSVDRTRVDLQFQLQQHSTMTRGLKNKLLNYENLAKVALYEKRLAKRCTMQVVCGPDDETFIRSHISQTLPVLVVGNGVDLDFFRPGSAPDARAKEPTVVFCGAMDYNPNVDALRWFFEAIHDKLLTKVPDLRVLIVGRNAVPEVQAYATRKGVTVTGGVPDVRPYYRRAWAQIVPLRIGGGTRLKIVESLAMGTPVVSTSIGAQGLDLRHGQDALLADDADSFVADTCKVLSSATLRNAIEASGIKVANERFSWASMGRILSNHYGKLFPAREEVTATQVPVKDMTEWLPPVVMVGVPFNNLTTRQTVERIDEMIASRKPHYLATANVDFTVQAMHDIELRRILMDAHLVLCDGMPLVWASRLLGNPLPERVAGSDLVPALLKNAAAKGHRVFFLGGEEAVARKAVEKVTKELPDLKVAGVYSPAFAPLLDMEHDDICEQVREAGTDILFVSFGCPKQEKWINMNYRKLGVPVCVGVGATIDFLAGNMKRAPRWMQVISAEWIFRLAQEPRRLYKRYFTDLVHFSTAILQQFWQMPHERRAAKPMLAYVAGAGSRGLLKLPPRLDLAQTAVDHRLWKLFISEPRHLVVDGSAVTFADSTGIAMLTTLQKSLRHSGHAMVIARASQELMNALKLMKLHTLFLLANTDAQAEQFIKSSAPSESTAEQDDLPGSNEVRLTWQNEVTAGNLDEVWLPTERSIQHASNTRRTRLAVDLSKLGFMDSSGVGLMIRTEKKCRLQGLEVHFENPTPTVRNVIRHLKLEKHFFGAS